MQEIDLKELNRIKDALVEQTKNLKDALYQLSAPGSNWGQLDSLKTALSASSDLGTAIGKLDQKVRAASDSVIDGLTRLFEIMDERIAAMGAAATKAEQAVESSSSTVDNIKFE